MAGGEYRQVLLDALKNNILAVWILGAFVGVLTAILWALSHRFSLAIVVFLDLLALALATFNFFEFYKKRRHLRFALDLQSVGVLLLMTAGIHFSGGISSPLDWLYVLAIVVEGMSLGGYRAFMIATAANALFFGLVGLEFMHLLPAEGLQVEAALAADPIYVSTHLASVLLFNYVIAFAVYFWAGKLFKQQADLKALDRAKDLFLSITSHELRTPLTPMKAQVQLLASGYLGAVSAKQKESLDLVLKNSVRLEKLIGDVMDISKISAGKIGLMLVKGSLRKIIENVADIERPLASVKGIEIQVKAEECPAFSFDPDRLTQVMTNLVDNAIKFSHQGSQIIVSLQKTDGIAQVGVSDTGEGISAQDQARLFTPFYRGGSAASTLHKGTGLGLAICKGLVEAHGGRIWLESVKGQGTTFYFTLPLKGA